MLVWWLALNITDKMLTSIRTVLTITKKSVSIKVLLPPRDYTDSYYSQSKFGEDWLGGAMRRLLLTCQHPSIPQLSAVPCSSWPGRLSVAMTGEGRRRWIRGMTKISPALTPLWVARHCHAARERVITVTFSHFKAHRQVWFHKSDTHYRSPVPSLLHGPKDW